MPNLLQPERRISRRENWNGGKPDDDMDHAATLLDALLGGSERQAGTGLAVSGGDVQRWREALAAAVDPSPDGTVDADDDGAPRQPATDEEPAQEPLDLRPQPRRPHLLIPTPLPTFPAAGLPEIDPLPATQAQAAAADSRAVDASQPAVELAVEEPAVESPRSGFTRRSLAAASSRSTSPDSPFESGQVDGETDLLAAAARRFGRIRRPLSSGSDRLGRAGTAASGQAASVGRAGEPPSTERLDAGSTPEVRLRELLARSGVAPRTDRPRPATPVEAGERRAADPTGGTRGARETAPAVEHDGRSEGARPALRSSLEGSAPAVTRTPFAPAAESRATPPAHTDEQPATAGRPALVRPRVRPAVQTARPPQEPVAPTRGSDRLPGSESPPTRPAVEDPKPTVHDDTGRSRSTEAARPLSASTGRPELGEVARPTPGVPERPRTPVPATAEAGPGKRTPANDPLPLAATRAARPPSNDAPGPAPSATGSDRETTPVRYAQRGYDEHQAPRPEPRSAAETDPSRAVADPAPAKTAAATQARAQTAAVFAPAGPLAEWPGRLARLGAPADGEPAAAEATTGDAQETPRTTPAGRQAGAESQQGRADHRDPPAATARAARQDVEPARTGRAVAAPRAGVLPGAIPPAGAAATPSAPAEGAGAGRAPEIVQHQALAEAIVARARALPRNGSVEVRFALQPEDLGTVRIHIESRGEQVTIRILAASGAAMDALGSGLARMSAQLSEAGFKQPQIDLGLEDSHDANQQQQHEPEERTEARRHAGRESAPERSAAGPPRRNGTALPQSAARLDRMA